MSPEVPLVLKSTPATDTACDVAGAFLGSNMFELKGEAWPEDNNVRLKVKGTASNGAKVMLYGSVGYVDEETVLYDCTLSVSASGQGVEQSVRCYLVDKATKEEREAKERELEEAKRKASPEYKTHAMLDDLFSAKRVGTIEKKRINWGSAIQSAANRDVSGVTPSVNSNKVIDVLIADGESKSGVLTFDPEMSLNLTLKDNSNIKVSFEASCTFELKMLEAYVIAFYSQDMTDVLYYIESSGENSVFLFSDSKLYKLAKKTVKQIRSIIAA